jgi:lactate dehydrogenase-like 2-hydroxyacid dehydrogenase
MADQRGLDLGRAHPGPGWFGPAWRADRRHRELFNKRVIAWSENLTLERAAECGAELVSKSDLFKQSDIVSIHLILSKRSRGLIGADDLASMKSEP